MPLTDYMREALCHYNPNINRNLLDRLIHQKIESPPAIISKISRPTKRKTKPATGQIPKKTETNQPPPAIKNTDMEIFQYSRRITS